MNLQFTVISILFCLCLAESFHCKVCRTWKSSSMRNQETMTEAEARESRESAPTWPSSSVEPMIKYLFHKRIEDNNIPLFKDWSSYSSSLPVRRLSADEPIILYKVKYFTPNKYLRKMAEEIVKKTDQRGVVKYLAAPSTSGKTCSVLPAFIESTTLPSEEEEDKEGGTHYLYLAFSNNNGRYFKVHPNRPSSDETIAEMQGASFMVKCIESLLDDPSFASERLIPLDDDPPNVGDSSNALENLLKSKFPENSRIWFHVDEHSKMCERGQASGANFSRGAFVILTNMKNCHVIATYTDRPSIPSEKSSSVCRYPIALPPPDINQIATEIPELNMIKRWSEDSSLQLFEHRLLINLKFRLYLKFRTSLGTFLHRRSDDADDFLKAFQAAADNINATKAQCMRACINLCALVVLMDFVPDPLAAELLVGICNTPSHFAHAQISPLFSDLI
jgi:hypothetical protein